jgi:DNA ligase (NAD+)
MAYPIPDDRKELERLVVHLATLYDRGEECRDFAGNVVEDTDYDVLYDTLFFRDPKSIAFAEGTTSPSDYDPEEEGLAVVIHDPPMTSIKKADGTTKTAKFQKFVADCRSALGNHPTFVRSFKHDGVAVRVYYRNGKLWKAGLRPRNGVKGIDVTENIKYVKGIPAELPLPLTLAIGGELECLHDDFKKVQQALAEAGEDLRKNPRNHTYGSINQQKDPKKTKDGRLTFIGYNITGFDDASKYYTTERQRAKWCNQVLKVNFVRVEPLTVENDFEKAFEELKAMEDLVPTLQYEVDGVVIKVDDLEAQEQMGHHGDDPTAEPRAAIAWKFEEERARATVAHLEWNATRTGRVSVTAIFDKPYKLAGTDVQRATCNNLGWAKKKGIGIGTVVQIYKAGKIIPTVETVVSNPLPVNPPSHCPSCNTGLDIRAADGTEDLYCPNDTCPAKHVGSLLHYLTLMEAKGLGESRLEQIVGGGKVRSIPDLYELTVDDLTAVELSPRQAILALATIHMVKPGKDDEKLLKAIEKARGIKKKVPAWQFFAALGIPRAGKNVGKLLVDHFGSFDKILDAKLDDLSNIPGIGDEISASIYGYLWENRAMVTRLLDKHVELELPKTDGKLAGLTFVLSGSFEEGKSFFEKEIQERSGKTSGSVSKKTNYLVYGPGAGEKKDKAEALQAEGYPIQIIDVEGLKAML